MKFPADLLLLLAVLRLSTAAQAVYGQERLPLRISWGHTSPQRKPFYLKLLTNRVTLTVVGTEGFEASDSFRHGAWQTQAGGGRIQALSLLLEFPTETVLGITNVHKIWRDLITQSDPDTAQRLTHDPAYRPDPRQLTVQLDAEGTRGFTLTVDQLMGQKAFWLPELDVYLSAGSPPPTFAEHQTELRPWQGQRVLDQVHQAPEATYEQFTALWADMGNPSYNNPAQTGPGHIICLAWDSSLPKFGVDRGAGVWNDYGNPDRFHCWLECGGTGTDSAGRWQSQNLADGLPVVTTRFESNRIQYAVEQFAYPLDGPPQNRKGDISLVLLQKVTLTNPSSAPTSVNIVLHQRRLLPTNAKPSLRTEPGVSLLEHNGRVLLSIQSDTFRAQLRPTGPAVGEKANAHEDVWRSMDLELSATLPGQSTQFLIVKLPSPMLLSADAQKLVTLEYLVARQSTLKFWADWLARGAEFRVPEANVNELFRANLWHALRLPRRYGTSGPELKVDLPYSNFAYDQRGTPWPVNQAVYVDYMIYDLRGYHQVAAEELGIIYRNNQEQSGHVGGFANWGVYTPGMLYSVAKNYLLSGDQAAFDGLLPQTLRALDWCEAEIAKGTARSARMDWSARR